MVKKPFKDLTIYLDIKMEEYKNCFENYEISNFGNMTRKMHNGEYKQIVGSILNTGYKYIQQYRNGKRKNYLFHSLVAQCFLGEKNSDDLVIDHIDRNKLNNKCDNLRYITQRENCCNADRFITEIPKDEEDRKKKVKQLWTEKNKDKISMKKKEYYNINQEKFKLKRKSNKIIVKCVKCNKDREIQKGSLTYNKSGKCYTCSSTENLQKGW